MSFRTTEEAISQIPALQLLVSMGYTYIPAAEVMRQRGGSLSNVILDDVLARSLRKINRIDYKGQEHPFTEENIQSAIYQLKTIRYDGLMKTNELVYDLISLGTALKQSINGDLKSYTLRYIDWDNINNNEFHVAAEFSVERNYLDGDDKEAKAIPDIVLFINGIPVCVIECKASHIDVDQGISQHIRNQKDEYIPKLFQYSQLLISTNKNEVRYATTGTPLKFWSLWREKEIQDEEVYELVNKPLSSEDKASLFNIDFANIKGYFEAQGVNPRQVTAQDRDLVALCSKGRLTDIIKRFVIFDAGIKKVPRYQQYFAIRKIMARVKNFDIEGRRQGGVIWHTQGSGKSLTMVMMAQALALDEDIKNPVIILVTDRIDLDDQIKKTFINCGLEPEQAKTGRHLLDIIKQNKASVITTIIDKFETALKTEKYENTSSNVFILVDESHRGQYGFSHANMKKMFPKACYLGFTGTPLLKKEKSTADKFGGIIDTYAINQAVEDKAVVPLLYEGRLTEQVVNKAAIDIWFERVCADLTEEQKADLKRKYSRAETLQKTEQTIYCRAFDISEHFRANWKGTGFKAQLIAPGKSAAIKYKQFLDDIGFVSSEVLISAPDTREGNEDIYDDNKEDVQRFWQKTMKQFGTEEQYNKQIISRFKNQDDPEIIIVVDKLLTGFDAPRNTVLYVTKSLKEHNLLQAIARVNRLYEGKDFGYIIDYVGLLGELDKALTSYSAFEGYETDEIDGTISSINEEIDKLPKKNEALWDIFKEITNKEDEEAFEQFLAPEDKRQEFYDALSEFAKCLAIALSSEKFVFNTDAKTINKYKMDLKRFQTLRGNVKVRYQESINYKDYEPKIQKLLDSHISAATIITIVPPINIFDDNALDKALGDQKRPAGKADLIASSMKRTITEKWNEDPKFYEKFSKLIDDTIAEFRQKRILEIEYLNKIKDIREAFVHRDVKDYPEVIKGNPIAISFYGNILEIMSKYSSDIEIIGETAKAIYDIIDSHRGINMWQNIDKRNAIVNDIDDYLFDVIKSNKGLPLSTEDIDDIISKTLAIAEYRIN